MAGLQGDRDQTAWTDGAVYIVSSYITMTVLIIVVLPFVLFIIPCIGVVKVLSMRSKHTGRYPIAQLQHAAIRGGGATCALFFHTRCIYINPLTIVFTIDNEEIL